MKNEEIKQACGQIIDALWLVENIEKLPNCNNCKDKNNCIYVPEAGQMTRINCFAWEGENSERV